MNRTSLLPSSDVHPPGLFRRSARAVTGLVVLLTGAWVPGTQLPEAALALYDLSPGAGEATKLPRGLEEISGLASTSDGRLFAHHDERAIIFQIDPEDGEVIKAFAVGNPATPGDFEGIAVAGGRFFLLSSSGQLLEFREGTSGSAVGFRTHALGLGARCELEGLAFDEVADALLLPCKEPTAGGLRGHLVVYSVPLSTMRPDPTPRIFLPLSDLAGWGLGTDFHPSAIEIHPLTRSLILVAAREEAMLELSAQGEVVAVQKLKRKDHPQPEGVAFLPDGTLLLADEGQGKRGTLTRYVPKERSRGGHP